MGNSLNSFCSNRSFVRSFDDAPLDPLDLEEKIEQLFHSTTTNYCCKKPKSEEIYLEISIPAIVKSKYRSIITDRSVVDRNDEGQRSGITTASSSTILLM
jgi:hypothetical protein